MFFWESCICTWASDLKPVTILRWGYLKIRIRTDLNIEIVVRYITQRENSPLNISYLAFIWRKNTKLTSSEFQTTNIHKDLSQIYFTGKVTAVIFLGIRQDWLNSTDHSLFTIDLELNLLSRIDLGCNLFLMVWEVLGNRRLQTMLKRSNV